VNYLIPPKVPTPFIVGFMSLLLDYATGDTLDIDETWVEVPDGEGMDIEKGESAQGSGW
jgi:hypothetical protein